LISELGVRFSAAVRTGVSTTRWGGKGLAVGAALLAGGIEAADNMRFSSAESAW
jgi:hypothetical protein